MKADPNTQRVYFLNHQTKTTTWEDPRPFPPSEREVDSIFQDFSDAKGAEKPKLSTVEGPRGAWVEQMVQMGFDRERVIRGCKIEKNKTIEQVADWLMRENEPVVEVVKEDPLAMLRRIFMEDLKAGVALSTEQYNLIYLTSHTPGSKYECPVCFDEDLDINRIFVLASCHHYLCVDCMSQHIVTLNKSLRASALPCPIPDCAKLVGHAEVKRCLPADEFERYQQFLLQDALSKVGECRWCPNPGCGTAMIGDPSIPLMRCPKPDCHFSFCFNCKEKWHTDLTCEQYQAWKKENQAGDARFVDWVAKNTKPCAKCHVAIQKNGGCNHMTCANCRHQFCWLCMQSVLGPDGKYKIGHWALDEASPCYNRMHT